MNELLLAIIAVSNAIDENSDVSAFNLFEKGMGGIHLTIECEECKHPFVIDAIGSLMFSKGFYPKYSPEYDEHTKAIKLNFSKGQ